jgi:hypothetical protein
MLSLVVSSAEFGDDLIDVVAGELPEFIVGAVLDRVRDEHPVDVRLAEPLIAARPPG